MAGKKSRSATSLRDESYWFKRSSLAHWLRHDTWERDIGLSLICNIDPDNFMHVEEWLIKTHEESWLLEQEVASHNLDNVVLLSEDSIYVLPAARNQSREDLGHAMEQLQELATNSGRTDIKVDLEDIRKRISRRRDAWDAFNRIKDIFMSNPDHVATNKFEPAYFLAWANKKNIEVPWLRWASDNGLLPTASEMGKPQDSKPAQPLKLTTRERNNYLKVIAALCKANSIDYNKRGVAQKIVGLVDESGGNIGEDTVRKILDRIKDILG